MPEQNLSQTRVVDPILSTHARGYRQAEMIGHLLLPYDSEAARWHAVERARLGRAGLTPALVK